MFFLCIYSFAYVGHLLQDQGKIEAMERLKSSIAYKRGNLAKESTKVRVGIAVAQQHKVGL